MHIYICIHRTADDVWVRVLALYFSKTHTYIYTHIYVYTYMHIHIYIYIYIYLLHLTLFFGSSNSGLLVVLLFLLSYSLLPPTYFVDFVNHM